MSKDQVSVKLSPELRQHLKAYKARQSKRSLKAAVVEVLESHFRLIQPPSQSPTIDSSIGRIASLEAKVTYLSEQLEALKQAIATPVASASPSATAAPTTPPKSSVDSSASSTANHTPSVTTASTDDFDDDIYDEPDEILYNFLEP